MTQEKRCYSTYDSNSNDCNDCNDCAPCSARDGPNQCPPPPPQKKDVKCCNKNK